ncbi:mannose-1-phosphate guanylyltransferase/mannose-6-phosphate isomerase [Shewanella sp. SG44-2]|uniref:mannose-1-phosphate guanylyltransferase/mannose-6-phosphate isomerase n=1 Tax=Shewanella sp. SG44-2 TaxID=2760962 RepID=UPI00160213AA|nr:mannose-1-phosphate guanylyltransferase/mannose-6-phosphate isomerase [Shewanella sp. SG44-2]MBB1428480.1 mannose-1-phosphate guanylyltransferase/mannose-6-phosphate isomerase [Shewanella sp. SG44-2]
MILPVILAGGTGSRLWPLSRKLMPKQFLKVTSKNTMLQETVLRLNSLSSQSPICICNEEHRFIVAEQMQEINSLGPIILEPVGRNTAPAIALAALSLIEQSNDGVMLVLPADHLISNNSEFLKIINESLPLANLGKLVTFGIVPSHPETGYGYIKVGDKVSIDLPLMFNSEGFTVQSFIEKPDIDTAKTYLDSGEYLWNSGMFMFKASRYLEELKKFRPDIYEVCKTSFHGASSDMDFLRININDFELCDDQSIDYAVMEPLCKSNDSSSVVVVPLDVNWNDIGSFSAIWDVSDKDEQGNVHRGDVLSHNSQNNLVISEQKLVATVGLDNCIVIETKDAVLVANKDSVQDVKKIVEQIKMLDRSEADIHRQVYRPWGHYDSIDFGHRDQVKRITVKPGQKLSIQMHHHRAEHWIVVSGTAKVTNGDKTFLLTENQSTYIPSGVIHALENPGVLELELIEVQTGSYLGEDDIVRFEDRYGRV